LSTKVNPMLLTLLMTADEMPMRSLAANRIRYLQPR
jgi:hypothetical protein